MQNVYGILNVYYIECRRKQEFPKLFTRLGKMGGEYTIILKKDDKLLQKYDMYWS